MTRHSDINSGIKMKRSTKTTTLLLDIGGALLTDGWDHHARKPAVASFKLQWAEVEGRHRPNFDI